MALDPKQRKWLDRFFPGLISALEALGPGEFEEKPPDCKAARFNCIRAVQVHAKYVLADGATVEIRTHSRLLVNSPPYTPSDQPINLTEWERFRYALHYGKTFEDCYFRFDLDETHGFHVHFRGEQERIHTPAENVIPDTRNMDPREFVKIVAKFRKDNKYPMRPKKQ